MSGARVNGEEESVVRGLAGFGNDFSSLIEYQAKLAALDLKESASRVVVPLVVTVAGVVLVGGAVPVALTGLGLLVASALAIAPGWGLLLTGLVVVLVAAVIAAVAAARVPRCFQSFRRSREELQRNVSWLRTVLVHSGRVVPRRRF